MSSGFLLCCNSSCAFRDLIVFSCVFTVASSFVTAAGAGHSRFTSSLNLSLWIGGFVLYAFLGNPSWASGLATVFVYSGLVDYLPKYSREKSNTNSKVQGLFGHSGFQTPVPSLFRGIYVPGTPIWTRIEQKSILGHPFQFV